MPKCYICGVEIKRGCRYKGDRYKSIYVCSEDCYNTLLEQKANANRAEPYPNYNKLTDYIKTQWGGSENVNWMLTSKQVASLVKKHGMTCKEIKMVLKYAIEIEGELVNIEYGIGQFIPKYIDPCMKFVEQINRAKELAEDMKDEEIVVRKVSKQMKKVKEEEWD